jgi:hypothetical protein
MPTLNELVDNYRAACRVTRDASKRYDEVKTALGLAADEVTAARNAESDAFDALMKLINSGE